MSEKCRVSFYIGKNLYQILIAEIPSQQRSRLVEHLLTSYFSVGSLEEVDEEIKKCQDRLVTLKQRKEEMITAGVAETKENGLRQRVYQEMLELFRKRIERIPLDDGSHMTWMQGPANINRCREIGLSTREVLDMLRKDCLKEVMKHDDISTD